MIGLDPRIVFWALYRPTRYDIVGGFTERAIDILNIRSNKICLYCLYYSAQHVLVYGYTVYDQCVQVFGTPTKGFKYRFVVKGYLYCLYQRPLISDILPLIISPLILTIDGGGDYPLQDVVDLTISISLGSLIVLGLFLIRWDISCYNSRVFDTVLKDTFSKNRCVFGVSSDDPSGSLYTGSKFGVVTISISKDTDTFVIDLRIGTFQDGGLKYNFAGEIAQQISYQIWLYSKGSTRIISLSTGAAEPQSNHSTPYFRYIFRDRFIRRGFDRRIKSRINEVNRPDYYRLNITLRALPSHIDTVESIDNYRDLVLLQYRSARIAREAAITFLISRFYFVLISVAVLYGVKDQLEAAPKAPPLGPQLYLGLRDSRYYSYPIVFLVRYIDKRKIECELGLKIGGASVIRRILGARDEKEFVTSV
ncbi:uncharacterized protein N7479_006308 [Penicillium vulpinum]|uniref:uncharacterized protein n=1 Tax=Penicillium vulpinum TaxID=29845 RepID=UPI002547C843|nr:uncharacterized protein N7479_006308 [Penicillium vulpinum]KAJ5959158.1 hypothetical protein N7479_006308 [Penicillium vulpinum]